MPFAAHNLPWQSPFAWSLACANRFFLGLAVGRCVCLRVRAPGILPFLSLRIHFATRVCLAGWSVCLALQCAQSRHFDFASRIAAPVGVSLILAEIRWAVSKFWEGHIIACAYGFRVARTNIAQGTGTGPQAEKRSPHSDSGYRCSWNAMILKQIPALSDEARPTTHEHRNFLFSPNTRGFQSNRLGIFPGHELVRKDCVTSSSV
jgi:hypothetical protein